MDFLDAVGGSERLSVVAPPEDVDRKALQWLRQHDEREYSYVDATSFVPMRTRRMTHALAFDGEFAAAGLSSCDRRVDDAGR